jgi:prepilin-type N-terminal cleavage/methylation domain-containing protein
MSKRTYAGGGSIGRRGGRWCAACGWSLIEMLVVVSVVAVLISLLSPALRCARESVRRTACAAELRQFGLAISMYRDAGQGLLPFADRLVSLPDGNRAPLDAIAEYLDTPVPVFESGSGPLEVGAPFRCPSDREYAPLCGFSYTYVPFTFMQVTNGSQPQRVVTQMYERDPANPVLRDSGPLHGREPVGGVFPGRNVLRFDGAVIQGEDPTRR